MPQFSLRRPAAGYSLSSWLGILAGALLLAAVLLGRLHPAPDAHRVLFRHAAWVNGVSFSPDGRWLATCSDDDTAVLWDARQGTCVARLEGHTDVVDPAVFSPDGRYLATASHDHTARLWEVPSGRLVARLEGHTGPLYDLHFSPDGRFVATAGDVGETKLWAVPTGRLAASITTSGAHDFQLGGVAPAVWALAYGRNGLLATGAEDGHLRLYRLRPMPDGDLSVRHLVDLEAHDGSINDVRFSPDGKLVASAGDDGRIRLWKVPSGELAGELGGHDGPVLTVDFTADGTRLASGGEDHDARLWDTRTGRCLRVLAGHGNWIESLAFSPDGRLLATGSEDNSVRLWDTRTGELRQVLVTASPCDCDGWVEKSTVAFSPDGHSVATAGSPLAARLWTVGR